MARVHEQSKLRGYLSRVPFLPFSLLLPLLSLSLWIAVIAVPITTTYLDVRASGAYSPFFRTYIQEFDKGLRGVPLRYAAQSAVEKRTGLMEGLNAQGIWVELLIDRCSPAWPMYWLPEGVELTSWRAITFPIWCLPFWALVGLGFDRVLSRRRMRWPLITLGTVLSVVSLGMGIGLAMSTGPEGPDSGNHFAWGTAMWGVLFLSFPVSGVLNSLRKRRLRAGALAAMAVPNPES